MDVAIGYHRSGRAARRVAADLAAMGARAFVIRVDLADPGAVRRLVAAAVVFFATCPRCITGQILAVDGGQGAGA
jgi:NAD(P)-dependent dehydrogenase (short-subunit alcohol dehydrogenase family)